MPKEAKCSVARCALYSSNALIMLGSNALVVIGILLRVFMINKDTFTNKYIRLFPITIIIFAIIISVLALVSSCSASKRNACCLTTCCIIIAWILITQIILGIVISEKKEMIYKIIKYNMADSLKYFVQKKSVKIEWDILTISKNCCGVENYKDWEFLFGDHQLPGACCFEPGFYCDISRPGDKEIFQTGCYEKIMYEFKYGIYLYEIINLIVCIFELENVVYGIYYVRAYVINTAMMEDSLSTSSSTSSI
ncbi:tetraspanin-9-like [Centruroides sculpturatus]|uniref:tetraspanin-9-like n=1 Tax=Centruroides sculpturatus TaxID=218467 RepID=UPI000C6E4843|nr:tetraspanin-9-like [Centruroides sculpturatus]